MEQHPLIPHKEVLKTDLPFRLASIYHDCGDYKAGPVNRKPGPPMCYNCMKYVPWFFYRCAVCDTYFIKDFNDNRFCWFWPTCWEHTQQVTYKFCVEHNFDYARFKFPEYPPVGLNPRTFTAEELEGVFDFD